jgi:hypothetical protein
MSLRSVSTVSGRYRYPSESPNTAGITVSAPKRDTDTDGPRCPGCGSRDVLPRRVYCRPSCKARHEHAEALKRPSLFTGFQTLSSEWPEDETNPSVGEGRGEGPE